MDSVASPTRVALNLIMSGCSSSTSGQVRGFVQATSSYKSRVYGGEGDNGPPSSAGAEKVIVPVYDGSVESVQPAGHVVRPVLMYAVLQSGYVVGLDAVPEHSITEMTATSQSDLMEFHAQGAPALAQVPCAVWTSHRSCRKLRRPTIVAGHAVCVIIMKLRRVAGAEPEAT